MPCALRSPHPNPNLPTTGSNLVDTDSFKWTRPFYLCILQAIKNWTRGRPGNEAIQCLLCTKVLNVQENFHLFRMNTTRMKRNICRCLFQLATLINTYMYTLHKSPRCFFISNSFTVSNQNWGKDLEQG